MLSLSAPQFAALLERYPVLYKHFVELFCQRTRLMFLAMEAWTIPPLEERLALHLVNLANGHGEREGDDLAIRLHMPQEQLAQLLDVTRQRISQILREWGRHGRLRYRYGHIVFSREWLAERAEPVHPIALRRQRVPAAH